MRAQPLGPRTKEQAPRHSGLGSARGGRTWLHGGGCSSLCTPGPAPQSTTSGSPSRPLEAQGGGPTPPSWGGVKAFPGRLGDGLRRLQSPVESGGQLAAHSCLWVEWKHFDGCGPLWISGFRLAALPRGCKGFLEFSVNRAQYILPVGERRAQVRWASSTGQPVGPKPCPPQYRSWSGRGPSLAFGLCTLLTGIQEAQTS